ncbi:probable receptor-like protein kinase At5g39030 [Solanum tuberosum]|uniref:probable receptor-like protein kinase At5g39030 n=1 Tax=Solanum tuberosum TaxID=4113 RepID=UPI00073A296A|nr:PREDICTED: probable receptor-like protein kinase At5g39030 [Solanum tuberosum]
MTESGLRVRSQKEFVVGLPLVFAFLVIKFRRRHLSMYDAIEGFLQTQNNFMPIRYNYTHIKRMTRGFKEKLGKGGYGSVYKGKLQSGRDVAVKIYHRKDSSCQRGWPHNILLDENFIPKISDFGLAKLYPTDNSIVTLTAARGTIGYVAPELINRSIGAISYKADVYSFGMLLMEMLDLKRHEVANEENSSQYFPYYIYDKFNKGKEILVDEEAKDDEKKMARKLSLVALWCIQMNPIQRPSMSRLLEMLESEVEVLEVPPQPLQSQSIVHQMMGSSMTFLSDSMALLENSVVNAVEVDICSH